MDKKVREISRFFAAPPRVFPLSVWCVSRKLLSRNTSGLVHPHANLFWRLILMGLEFSETYTTQ